ncbi:hypothetical protein [Nocardioides sp. 616]|uniref:hypothetical protein n=1 Tax=Nocardioides sp. 616 TaxID=2268090 RepID=UPI0013B470D0|nr:hypothetical protein [Nocardioides sp. 616]
MGAHHLDVEMSLELDSSGESVCVVVQANGPLPEATMRLSRFTADEVDVLAAEAALPALGEGESAARELAVGEELVGDVGLTASVSVDGESIGSTFLAVRFTEHGFVTAGSLGLLDDAELLADRDAGRLTEAEYQEKLHELHVVDVGGEGVEVSPR